MAKYEVEFKVGAVYEHVIDVFQQYGNAIIDHSTGRGVFQFEAEDLWEAALMVVDVEGELTCSMQYGKGVEVEEFRTV